MKSALQQLLPKLVLAPTTLILVVCVYGFIGWTALLSFTKSRMMPQWDFIGLDQYIKLFDNPRWMVALENLGAFCFFFILISLLLGVVLAIFLDQKIRSEGALRTIYLYPMAVSFIVTGTAWKWILNPGLGIEKLIREIGFQSFEFRCKNKVLLYKTII